MKELLNKSIGAGAKVNDAIKGKKTYAVGAAAVLFQMLTIAKPNLFSPNAKDAILLGINSGLFVTLAHKLIRNRKVIWEYTKKPLRWLQRIKKAR